MPGATFAAGDRIALRTVEEADLDFLRDARNDPRVRRPLTINDPANGEQVRAFFENAISADNGASLLACVDSHGDGSAPRRDATDPVGMVSLFDEDETAGSATLAYWVVPEHWGNGYCTEAASLLCEHAFRDRRLHKLRADALATNEGSQRVLNKLGFEREGVLRDEKFVDGEHTDVYRYGLLADEWLGE